VSLRGSTSEFPLESVIGLLAGTSKTGELQVRSGVKVGALGFAGGRLVAAVMEGEVGENGLGLVFSIGEADFEFTPWETAPDANLESGDLVAQLKRAAESRDRIAKIRESIPDDHARFRLSEKAADQGGVSFTPDRWRALLAVNGERDVFGIAEQLRLGRMQTLTLLADLVKDGVIETAPPREDPPSPPPPAYSAPEPEPSPWRAPEPEPPAPSPEPSNPAPAAAWPSDPAPSPSPWREEPRAETSAPAADWSRPASEAPDWTKAEPAPPRPAPEPEMSAPASPTVAEEPRPMDVPRGVDDRLSSLSGLFAPGPAANAPAQPTAQPADTRRQAPSSAPAESWHPAPPASSEAPANAWAPAAKPTEPAPAGGDPWGRPMTSDAPRASAPTAEWAPPAQPAETAEAPAEKKKAGGFLSRFRREEPAPASAPTPIVHLDTADVATKTGKLASLSNALLMEYNSGGYGKGKIETKLANLLMRVDEQADPIDRPLPVVDDLIDAAALEREGFDEQQAVPYLATLVRQIYEDAERAFGKDKAKKGYKAAQQQVFGGDSSVLQAPELAGKLPKV
jgi:hypothetical protein